MLTRWFFLSLLSVLPACGAIMRPGPFPVTVLTEPTGVSVFGRDREVGTTPCAVAVDRGHDQLELRLAGHVTRRVTVPSRRNPWFFANLLTGGVSLPIDVALGGDRTPARDSLFVRMTRGDPRQVTLWMRPSERLPLGRASRAGGNDVSGAGAFAAALVSVFAELP